MEQWMQTQIESIFTKQTVGMEMIFSYKELQRILQESEELNIARKDLRNETNRPSWISTEYFPLIFH